MWSRALLDGRKVPKYKKGQGEKPGMRVQGNPGGLALEIVTTPWKLIFLIPVGVYPP